MPARVSGCLRRESPALSSTDGAQAKGQPNVRPVVPITAKPARETAKNSHTSGNSSGVEDWFDQSNSCPAISLGQSFVDGEPPYFLRQQNSLNSLSELSELNRDWIPSRAHLEPGGVYADTNGSTAKEYRSVIDDLTIENRKLRERLRKYEASYRSPHLEKDRLFEVKIHGLPARKKRELEETLREFAASLDGPGNPLNLKVTSRSHHHHTAGDASHNPSPSSTSNSRLVDSAYASMSNSGPTSTFASNLSGLGQKASPQHTCVKGEKVQSFLHSIPEELLPKHSTVMTERQKKIAVVRRLEQLFTGKTGSTGGDHSQPLQQQEVSKSATRAEHAADGFYMMGGFREAHMLPYEMEIDATRPEKISDDSGQEILLSGNLSEPTPEDSQEDSSPNQRPTRPLDLDPDRAQIPSDNVDYIRHLGLPTPQFTKMEPTDAAADADGWIFLNLLANMAQLHTINVTPDFIRSALVGMSKKFQLSRDGKKVRWRGGTEGTRFSSDSGAGSSRNQFPRERGSLDEITKKRRKIDVGRFASDPIDNRDTAVPVGASQPNSFHYKPLFHYQGSSSEVTSSDESDYPHECSLSYVSELGKFFKTPRHKSQGSRSPSRGKHAGEDGAIVFYSGAQFCIDLSRDRGNIITPVHVTGVGKDGYSNHTQDALGCNPKKRPYHLYRTPSGSNIPFRPFKDFSKVPDILQIEEMQPKIPGLVAEGGFDVDFSPGWASNGDTEGHPPMEFNASGLGGTIPADHFITKVGTQRTILDGQTRAKLSIYSAAPGPASKRLPHRIPGSLLDSFEGPEGNKSFDSITTGPTGLQASQSTSLESWSQDLPVKIKIISTESSDLDPSPLPAPSGYYAASSSASDDSDASSASSIFHLHHDRPFFQHSLTSASESIPHQTQDFRTEDNEMEINVTETDSSIDMLAHVRKLDPQLIAEREHEFDKNTRRDASSVTSVAGESRYSSSESSSVSSEDEDEDEDEDDETSK